MRPPDPSITAGDLEALRRRTSAKWRLDGPGVLPLSIAEMDYDLAEPVTRTLTQAVRSGDTGYAWPGPEYGEAVAGFASRRWGWDVDPARVSIVPDVGVGVTVLLRRICTPGDGVVINPPVYPPFTTWVADVGARCVEAPLTCLDDGRWRLDLQRLEDAFRQGPKAYVLCNPHNPVGRVHSREELTAVLELAHRYGVVVLSDEIHAPLTLPGARFTPLLTLPGAAEVAVSLLSASKAFNLAGLKCAAVISGAAPGGLDTPALLEQSVWHSGHLGVLAGTVAFGEGDGWLDALLATLDDRRRELGELLAERLPQLSWQPPEATYLAWLDWRATGLDDPHRPLLDRGVGLDPGPRFGRQGRGFMRLNFATTSEVLDLATRRMAAALVDRPAAGSG